MWRDEVYVNFVDFIDDNAFKRLKECWCGIYRDFMSRV